MRATARSVSHVDLLCAFMSAVSVELIDRGGRGINLKSSRVLRENPFPGEGERWANENYAW